MLMNLSICMVSFVFLLIISIFLMLFSMYFLMENLMMLIEWELLSLNSSHFVMIILLDWMSLMFMSFVLFISSMVIIYSKEYMMDDKFMDRFIMLILLFILSMMLVIISPNLISILLGWDGLGLVSYCLVIYYQNIKSFNAGMLTALSNRIGDVALLMAISWMFNYGSWNYLFYLEYSMNNKEMLMIMLFIILAAFTKSAQIPFSSWLPAAMAAPTPVSALVHSSTLVTAGIYLLIRFYKLIELMNLNNFILLLSMLTMFMAGLGANYENDLKKIIALSTLSQLGLMMSILAMGFLKLSFFHLLTHALFKALLFLCAGMLIHNMNNFQDIRYMGSLTNKMPFTLVCFNTSNLSLCGFPFISGFYSKDLIMEIMLMSYLNMLSFFLFFLSIGLTVSYSFRLSYYSMIGSLNLIPLFYLNENIHYMNKSMILLFMMMIMGGCMLNWMIFPIPKMICLPIYLKMLTLMLSFIGGLIGYFLPQLKIYLMIYFNLNFYDMKMFFSSMWFMPVLSTYMMLLYTINSGKIINKSLDQGWSEYYMGYGLNKFIFNISYIIKYFNNNSLKIYFKLLILWMMMFLFIIMIMMN
uniref:NADH-ubiquinone oxidoreductase chain 5 n=1 Tax=Pamphilius sp. ZJUH_2016023 TaxID=2491164 RepID=A0A3S8V102_9HYME|nr:NADH dehydrogenase subunit 5 [Pamphilius sp. ZJUH_2016023]